MLACWFGVSRSTITRAIGEVRPLLAERGCTVEDGIRLHTLADVVAPTDPICSPTCPPRCNHVDSLMHLDPEHLDPEHLRPMLPCFQTAFDALTAWVQDGREPPPSATVPRPAGNGATDLLNDCSL